MTPATTRQWILARKSSGRPIIDGPESLFQLVETPLPQLDEEREEVLLKVLYLSNDPAQRLWIDSGIDERRLYVKPVDVGEIMRSYSSIAEVVQSKCAKLQVGTLVSCATGWCEYAVVPASECMPIEATGQLSPTQFSGVFGIAGVTAYYGLVDTVHAGPDDAVVISGAAGAVGSAAVQIAKNVLGCKKVIGIAGTDEKCRWVETLGADVCLNYKSKTFLADLASATEPFVEVFFDNTGGEVLDFMLTRLEKNGRVAACGAISEYNIDRGSRPGIKNWYDVIAMRLNVRGLVVTDLAPARWGAIVHELLQGYHEGKIQADEAGQTIVPASFEDIPKVWMRLFDGQATGKLLTKLA
jgi:NADPH-dependent curcumin reductase CurA